MVAHRWRQQSLRPHLSLSSMTPRLRRLKPSLPLPGAEVEVQVHPGAVETSLTTPIVEIAVVTGVADAELEEAVKIIKVNLNKPNRVQSLTRRVPKLLQMFQTMPAPSTGRMVEMRLTVPIPSTATGSASSLLGHLHERLASLELVK